MEFVGIGVKLAHRSLAADREAVISQAFAAGVRTMICTGTSVRGSQDARTRRGALFATAGVHPHDATIDARRALAKHP